MYQTSDHDFRLHNSIAALFWFMGRWAMGIPRTEDWRVPPGWEIESKTS